MMPDINKYNFVVFINPSDYYEFINAGLYDLPNLQVMDFGICGDGLDKLPAILRVPLRFVHKVHFSGKINNIVKLPLKSLWIKPWLKTKFINDNKPVVFLFYRTALNLIEGGFIQKAKRVYPSSKFVFMAGDVIGKIASDHKHSSVADLIKPFDVAITYNPNDVKTHGIRYSPPFFKMIAVENDESIPESDVFYCGQAKDRLDKIHETFSFLVKNGLSCDFVITGVKPEERLDLPGIHYNKTLPFSDVLKRARRSKCCLELSQAGSNGITTRALTAIMINKKLVTDVEDIFEYPEFDLTNTRYLELNEDLIRFIKNDGEVKFNYNGEWSAENGLRDITDALEKID